MRKKGRVDENQKEIVSGLRAIGATVALLSSLGSGIPDILVGFRGKNYLMEIKNPEKPIRDQRLTKDEQVWIDAWWGQVDVVKTLGEGLVVIGAKNGKRMLGRKGQ